MSEPQSSPPPAGTRPRPGSSASLLVALALLLLAGGVYGYVWYTTPLPPPVDELRGLKAYLADLGRTQTLASGYTDADKDLVADPPTESGKLLKVEKLVFSVVGSEDPEKARAQWQDFMAALGKATRKPVAYAADVATVEEQATALREGRLHVTAFNTGQVAAAVNTAGFVPLFCPADAEGKYAYEMRILVRQDSPIQKPEDLRGKVIGLVALSSNSGGKAPLVLLKKSGLLPGRDYTYKFTGDHARSVKELVRGQYDAVCVASDLLARAVAAGEVRADQFRAIYTSDAFPPLCFGVPHNLPSDLRAQVARVFADFSFAGTSVEARYKAQGYVRFVPVNYAPDWKLVREVDAGLEQLLDGQ